MAFLCTFMGLLIASIVWVACFLGLRGTSNRVFLRILDWISPENITGWIVYAALCIAFCLLMFRLLAPRPADGRYPLQGPR